ncbi:hypothetical protein DFS34DRAFT_202348 [Phlyctochytrium arcticum]|nr:hypothetical protein DFS34DRAFT_202348 [Phlyctochytrium arcticum]
MSGTLSRRNQKSEIVGEIARQSQVDLDVTLPLSPSEIAIEEYDTVDMVSVNAEDVGSTRDPNARRFVTEMTYTGLRDSLSEDRFGVEIKRKGYPRMACNNLRHLSEVLRLRQDALLAMKIVDQPRRAAYLQEQIPPTVYLARKGWKSDRHMNLTPLELARNLRSAIRNLDLEADIQSLEDVLLHCTPISAGESMNTDIS